MGLAPQRDVPGAGNCSRDTLSVPGLPAPPLGRTCLPWSPLPKSHGHRSHRPLVDSECCPVQGPRTPVKDLLPCLSEALPPPLPSPSRGPILGSITGYEGPRSVTRAAGAPSRAHLSEHLLLSISALKCIVPTSHEGPVSFSLCSMRTFLQTKHPPPKNLLSPVGRWGFACKRG